jgi:O-antigen/teichoic acid export membrane protein
MSNAFYIFLNWFAISALNFLYWIVAGKLLLSAEYGIASTVFALTSIISSLTLFGLDSSLRKLIPEYQAKNQKEKIYGVIKFSFKVFLLTNLIVVIAIFISTPFLSTRVFKSKEITLPLYISAVAIPMYTLGFLTNSILFGFQDMKTIFTTTFSGTVAKNIFSAILILLGFTYFGPIIGFLIGISLAALLRLKKIEFEDKGRVDKKELILYSLTGFVGTVNFLILTQTPPLILSALASIEATGIYTLAYILATPISIIPQTLTRSAFPILSQLYGKKDSVRIEKILFQVFRYCLLITLPLSFVLLVFPKQVISLMGNPSYMKGYMLLPLLAFALAFANLIFGIGGFFLSSLYALGKPKLSRNIIIIQSVVFLCITFSLVKQYSFMAIGYAFLAVGAITFFISFFSIKKFYKIRIEPKPLLKITLSTIIFLSVLYFLKPYGKNIFYISIIIITALVTYLFSLLLLRFFTRDDLKLLKDLEDRIPKLKKVLRLTRNIITKFV